MESFLQTCLLLLTISSGQNLQYVQVSKAHCPKLTTYDDDYDRSESFRVF
jgi:hypothetical protein